MVVDWKSEHQTCYTSASEWGTIWPSSQCGAFPGLFALNLLFIFLSSKDCINVNICEIGVSFQDAISKPDSVEKVPSIWIEHNARHNGKK